MASRRKREQQAAAAAAAAPPVRKPSLFRGALVIAIGVLTLLASFVVVPVLANRLGLHEEHVGYAMATVAALVVVVTIRVFKAMMKAG
jgi:uncharacterized membrane protein YcjF (UPF0283 family)